MRPISHLLQRARQEDCELEASLASSPEPCHVGRDCSAGRALTIDIEDWSVDPQPTGKCWAGSIRGGSAGASWPAKLTSRIARH